MKILRNQSTVLVLFLALVFVAYRRLLSTPLWSARDFEVLHDAFMLSGDPLAVFRHLGALFSQPLLQLGFLLEYRLFGIDPCGYMMVNLVVHGINSFLVYRLSMLLFPRPLMSLLAGILFALSVGHYGKILMTISGLESMISATLYLAVLYCLIRNDMKHEGRIRTLWFASGVVLLGAAGLAGNVSLSMLGCLLAYKFFFFKERGRRGILSADVLILVAVGVVIYAAQESWGWPEPPIRFSDRPGPLHFTWHSIKNLFRYLNLLVFPMQQSSLVVSGHPAIQFVYQWRTPIRVLISLAIVSFGFFGILFGSRPIRFFIAWTVITVLPFTISDSGSWLNLQHLYLTAVGFCVILAAGTAGSCSLISHHRWKRLVPLAVPLFFVAISLTVTFNLDAQNRRTARRPETIEMLRSLETEILSPRDWPPADRPG